MGWQKFIDSLNALKINEIEDIDDIPGMEITGLMAPSIYLSWQLKPAIDMNYTIHIDLRTSSGKLIIFGEL